MASLYFLHHVTVQTPDIDASLHLYCDILGMELVTRFTVPGKKIFLLAAGNGTHIELFSDSENRKCGENCGDGPLVHIALGTTDTCASIEKVRSAGFKVTREPATVDLEKYQALIAFFTGPGGEEIEFFQVL